MILSATMSNDFASGLTTAITLDRLLGYAASQRPDDIALIDPPNRAEFTTGAPRTLTYAQAERAVAAIAARLHGLGLQPGHAVGLQLPNTVEGVLAFLGVLRAGLIASPLPLLWRQADCAAAMAMIGAQGLIASARIATTDHCELALHTAAEVFTIRHVCVFGGRHDGMVPLDDVFDASPEPVPATQPTSGRDTATPRGARMAAATWDVDAAGLLPVARSHIELTAAGFEIMLEGRFAARSVILSSLCLGSLAGIASTLASWLLSRGTLVLHHPFDPAVMRRQILDHRCDVVIVPGTLAVRCAEAGMFRDSAVGKVVAVWRAPERLAACQSWQLPSPSLMDVTVFGETGLIAAMRGPDGKSAGLRPGAAPRQDAPVLIEAMRTAGGTIALRGPMVPPHRFPRTTDKELDPTTDPDLAADAAGFVDTAYPCRILPGSGTFVVTGPPDGIVTVGGYRFVVAKLRDAVAGIDPSAMIAAFPDGLTGQRIAGAAARREDVQEALSALGLSPLVVNAFRPRRSSEARNAA
jgi:hypothetical protein